ncbi:hypothetical protein AVEN_230553-1 [Araneus ventricosus]|uniref:Uncharacterized protein n=1 Tax=Araneus ventricosus TaxID=182803 RepID=A0A4Y2QE09_ARAVE|nr:hypothetical protein AVEN_230553-1 [Araneus ventricosus]
MEEIWRVVLSQGQDFANYIAPKFCVLMITVYMRIFKGWILIRFISSLAPPQAAKVIRWPRRDRLRGFREEGAVSETEQEDRHVVSVESNAIVPFPQSWQNFSQIATSATEHPLSPAMREFKTNQTSTVLRLHPSLISPSFSLEMEGLVSPVQHSTSPLL